MARSTRRRLASCLVAGLLSGLVVLGAGGRLVMRVLAFTTPEAPRFTWGGLVWILGAGAAWGLVTAPLLLLSRYLKVPPPIEGPAFGLLALALAVPPFFAFSGFQGSLVAPALFLWLSALLFPVLFATHGLVVRFLYMQWQARP